MLELCRHGRFMPLLFFFLLLSSISLAEECSGGVVSQDEIPCIILLGRNDSDLNCDTVTVKFFRNDTFLYSQQMDNYTGSFCNGTFNETMLGTYPITYTTGDTGSIIVEGGTNMIYLFYFWAAITAMLVILGYAKEDVVSMSLGAMGLCVVGIYVLINGFNGLNNMLTDFLSILFIGLGFYFFIPLMELAMEELDLSWGV